MISGHLSQKHGYWHVVLNLKDDEGKRKQKRIATHLPIKGNKKRAEEILTEFRIKYAGLEEIRRNSRGISFDEYMQSWIASMETKVAPSTYNSCKNIVQNSVCPYFKERHVTLRELKPSHIESYYEYLHKRGVSNNTIIRHHTNIRKALDDAYRKDLILTNPADKIKRPCAEDFITHPYSVEESNRLLEVVRSEKLGLVIIIALFYELRRSEVLGLRWGAIDFENDTFIINHSVTQVQVDGKYSLVTRNKVKRASSFRTMPLIPAIKERLLWEKERRNPGDDDYVCVDERGAVIKPNYVSLEFPKLLKRHGLRPIRFHDLRHSCAGLLIAQRVPLIEVQQWLGHSTISTTADLYAHLDYKAQEQSASMMESILG